MARLSCPFSNGINAKNHHRIYRTGITAPRISQHQLATIVRRIIQLNAIRVAAFAMPRVGSISTFASAKSRAAMIAMSHGKSLRRTFFHRKFGHSAVSRSGTDRR